MNLLRHCEVVAEHSLQNVIILLSHGMPKNSTDRMFTYKLPSTANEETIALESPHGLCPGERPPI